MKLYLSGPMTGLTDYNKPAFAAAQALLAGLGHDVVNPHTLDEKDGGFPGYEKALRRDVVALMGCDGIAMLPGWHKSRGSKIESAVAEVCGLPMLDATTGQELSLTCLDWATMLVEGPRNADYGPPEDDLAYTAEYWSTWLRRRGIPAELTGHDVAMMMGLLKISREGHARKPDNLIDLCGYARCAERCRAAG